MDKYIVNSLNEITEEECQKTLGMSRDEAQNELLNKLMIHLSEELSQNKEE